VTGALTGAAETVAAEAEEMPNEHSENATETAAAKRMEDML